MAGVEPVMPGQQASSLRAASHIIKHSGGRILKIILLATIICFVLFLPLGLS